MPCIATLAKNYIVCDRWHASVPRVTWPNRLFVHGASSYGYAGSNYQPDGLPLPKSCESIFEGLQNSGYSWKTCLSENLKTSHSFPFVSAQKENRLIIDDFYKHALADQLPTYSFLGPDLHLNSQHIGQNFKNCMKHGDDLIGKVYEAILSNLTVWEKTLFVITYDEGGGYFDSTPSKIKVPSPSNIKKGNWPPAESLDFDFSVLGVRVPTLFI